MADDSMTLLEMLRKASAGGDVDILREGVRILAQAIMEAEVTEVIRTPASGRPRIGDGQQGRPTWPLQLSDSEGGHISEAVL